MLVKELRQVLQEALKVISAEDENAECEVYYYTDYVPKTERYISIPGRGYVSLETPMIKTQDEA